MEAKIEYKNNCIKVSDRNYTDTLYDSDIAKYIQESTSKEEVINKVYDYFAEDFDINYRKLKTIVCRIYKNLKE